MGMTNSAVFGKVGIFFPAFWAGPNFRTNILNTAPKLPLTIYMDIGSAESSSSQNDSNVYWLDAFTSYNKWLDVGYAVNSDLLMYPKCGAVPNEAAWSGRLPTFYQFALSLWCEPNPLALAKYPPEARDPHPQRGHRHGAAAFPRATRSPLHPGLLPRPHRLVRAKRTAGCDRDLGRPRRRRNVCSRRQSTLLAFVVLRFAGAPFPNVLLDDAVNPPAAADSLPR